jgi:hypothetical protein
MSFLALCATGAATLCCTLTSNESGVLHCSGLSHIVIVSYSLVRRLGSPEIVDVQVARCLWVCFIGYDRNSVVGRGYTENE